MNTDVRKLTVVEGKYLILYVWQEPVHVLNIVSAVGIILLCSLRLIVNTIVHRGVVIHCNKCVDFE